MKSVFLILLAILLLSPAEVQARLGETQQTIEARMGKAILPVGHAGLKSSDGERLLFHEPGWAVVITFWNGRSCHEQYYKISPMLDVEVVKGWFTVNGTYWEKGEKNKSSVAIENLGRHSESWTPRDVAAVLTANSNGKSWKTKQAGTVWISPDGQRQARYFLRQDDGEYLVVTTTAFDRQLAAWDGKGNPPTWPIDAMRLRQF